MLSDVLFLVLRIDGVNWCGIFMTRICDAIIEGD